MEQITHNILIKVHLTLYHTIMTFNDFVKEDFFEKIV